MDVLPLYTTCNEVAALHGEMNKVVVVLLGGTTLDWVRPSQGYHHRTASSWKEFFDGIRAPDGLDSRCCASH